MPSNVLASEPARPNVLFLFADDMRADTIAALGNTIILTPNLDKLVHKGLSFKQAYMQGAMQGATCVPSRAMLLSGRSLFHIDEKLKAHPTWPHAFGEAGYTTFISGKWHNGPDSVVNSFQVAKSVFTGGMVNPLQAKLGNLENGKMATPQLVNKHTCEAFADEAIKFIKGKHDKPTFCYVPFNGPHDPHIVPDSFKIQYDPAKIPLPKNFMPQHPFDNGDMSLRDETLLPWPRPQDKVQQMLADYYRYISFVDFQIGRILDSLEASGQAKNTIIVFAADSGVARGSHGLVGKQNLYEHSIRVPLIFCGGAIANNKATDAKCYLYDVMPTLGKLCNVPAPKTSEGIPFNNNLLDPYHRGRDSLVFAYRKSQRAIIKGDMKLIHYPDIHHTQLFDLSKDPYEMNNLYVEKEDNKTVTDLMKTLKVELEKLGDTTPLYATSKKPMAWKPPVKK